MKIIILGSGLVGHPMAIDLASDPDFEVSVADINEVNLLKVAEHPRIQTIKADLSDQLKLQEILAPFDFVLDAVPGHMGFRTFKTIIESGKNVVDIAFFPEDPFLLDSLAKAKGVTAVMDMGVAPGMSNVLIGYVSHQLDKVDKAAIYVGGLPKVRTWPFEYKAVFSPIDVIEEYTRPSRIIRHGEMITLPALSEPELMDFPGVGTLEAFNSDGLRSLAYTIKANDMIEKTLRFPGHIEIMRIFRETGFFRNDFVSVGNTTVRPLDLTSRLLFEKWKLGMGEEDFTVMKVKVEGDKGNRHLIYTYDLLDHYDIASQTHSMARTTGYTATAAVRMIARGLYQRKGITVPEFIGEDENCVGFLLAELKDRGVCYEFSVVEK